MRCRVFLTALTLMVSLAGPAVPAPTLDGLLEQAARALSMGDDGLAVERLDAASRRADANAGVFIALARLQLRRGDLKAAHAAIGEALIREPARADALALKGDILRAAGRLDEARASYDAALLVDPAQVRARTGNARLLVAEGDLAAARALEAPADTRTLALRLAWADAEADGGHLAAAIAELDRLLEQNPGWVPALIRRGDYHRRLGDVAAAHRDLQQAVQGDALSPEARYRRGLLRRDLNDLRAALDDFNRAIGLDPEFIPAYVARGALYQGTGQQNVALRDFQIALELDPNNADALAHSAASECARAEFARCLKAAEQALARRPADWRAHVARGHALLGQGAPDRAVEAYGAAIRHAPAGEEHWLLARLQKHLKPRLEDRGGFSWQFLAARDVGEVEELMVAPR